MKDNTNPIYLQEFFTTAPFANVDDFSGVTSPNKLAAAGIAGTVGAGSKFLKDTIIVKKILSEYPDPMKLKEFLLTTLKNSKQAQILASRLTPDMNPREYRSYIRKYICHGSLGRYLLHAIGGTYSLAGNAIDAGVNEFTPVNDIITNGLT